MSKIDGQMMSTFKQMTQNCSDQGTKVSEAEAMILIRRAQVLNGTYTSSCTGASENKGTKNLKKILYQNEDKFSPESKFTINSFLQTGRVISSQTVLPAGFSPSTGAPSIGGGAPLGAGGPPMGGGAPLGAGGPPMGSGAPLGAGGPPMGSGAPLGAGGPPMGSGAPLGAGGPPMGGGAPLGAGGPPMSGGALLGAGGPPMSSGASLGAGGPPMGGGASLGAGGPPLGSGAPLGARAPAVGDGAPLPSRPVVNPAGPGAVGVRGSISSSGIATPSTGRPSMPNTLPSTPTRGAPAPTSGATGATGGTTGITTPFGTRVLDFTAKNRTWNCHWFPMQENRPGGDATNNLYAKGGALHKLDMVTGGTSQQYEYAHHRKGLGDGGQYGWWGHCNDAAQVACCFQAPRHSVSMTARDGSTVTFDTNDIQGLLVKASGSLITKVDFKGNRFNTATRDDPSEPRPAFFMEVMKEWAAGGLPFVLDIDRESQVWNFPYDQVKIDESTKAPQGFNASGLPSDGTVKYYHIHMEGTGYDSKIRNYECYVRYDANGTAVDSNWIKTPNTNNNPDFMWRPHPMASFQDRSQWQLRGKPSNPQIDMQVIYDIYMKSIS